MFMTFFFIFLGRWDDHQQCFWTNGGHWCYRSQRWIWFGCIGRPYGWISTMQNHLLQMCCHSQRNHGGNPKSCFCQEKLNSKVVFFQIPGLLLNPNLSLRPIERKYFAFLIPFWPGKNLFAKLLYHLNQIWEDFCWHKLGFNRNLISKTDFSVPCSPLNQLF